MKTRTPFPKLVYLVSESAYYDYGRYAKDVLKPVEEMKFPHNAKQLEATAATLTRAQLDAVAQLGDGAFDLLDQNRQYKKLVDFVGSVFEGPQHKNFFRPDEISIL